jgi:hypothetical protein
LFRQSVIALVACAVLASAPFTQTASAQRPARRPVGAVVLEPSPEGGRASRTDSREVSVIVHLDGDSLAARARSLGRTLTAKTAGARLAMHPGGREAREYTAQLRGRQDEFERRAQRAVPGMRVGHRLQVLLNAVSMVVPADSLADLRNVPGVKAVYADARQQVQTTQSANYIGTPTLWQQLGGQSQAGAGVVIGVIDSGVWPEHPSLSDPSPSGGAYPVPVGWNGAPCEFGSAHPSDAAFACNNKLIGARRMMATYDSLETLLPGEFPSARDDSGHGTHMATTAAGNGGVSMSAVGNPLGTATGIAPRAHVAVYKVCGANGCYNSDAVAAIQQAVLDGVDIINYAVSGGTSPFSDPVSLAFLDAYNAGVFVATAAGNTGLGTVNHASPWTTTAGATTINRSFQSTLYLAATGGASLTLTGVTVTGGIYTGTSIVNAADYGDPYCANASPAGTFAGRLVVCARGGNSRTEKSFNIQQRGAIGMVLINPSNLGTSTDLHYLPTVHLEKAASDSLLAFLAARTGEIAAFTRGVATTATGDVMASFSSRGGATQLLGVNKPDLVAPGVQIVAGHTPSPATAATGAPGQLAMVLEGTSVASAHVAGGAALLKALNPLWTPGQIASALMMSATAVVRTSDGAALAGSLEFGSGRIQLQKAGRPGISISPSPGEFLAKQTHLWDVNYPSLHVPVMPGVMTVRRTIQNLENVQKTWAITAYMPSPDVSITVPSTIVLPPGGSASFDITINAATVLIGHVRLGWLGFTEVGGTRALQFPITFARVQNGFPIITRCDSNAIDLNATTTCTVSAENTTFTASDVTLYDVLPSRLALVPGSVVNGTAYGNAVAFQGNLAAAIPGAIDVRPGPTNEGYLSLSNYYAPFPCAGSCDNRTFSGPVPEGILYNGTVYTSIEMSTNGFMRLGGGGGNAAPVNLQLPSPLAPSNTLAPFWTDLHPAGTDGLGSGTLYAGQYAFPSGRTWLVLEWKDVVEKNGTAKYSFQVWLRVGGTVEDITFTYSKLEGNGAGGFATVGAQNTDGSTGESYYYNGSGGFPSVGLEGDLIAASPGPSPGGARTITFQVRGVSRGTWTNCGVLVNNLDSSASVSCFNGTVK